MKSEYYDQLSAKIDQLERLADELYKQDNLQQLAEVEKEITKLRKERIRLNLERH